MEMVKVDGGSSNLFDRKFITAHLKASLLCPKCRSPFSQEHQKLTSGGNVGHRPFLLACGHSMCENCIETYRLDLSCAVCFSSAPPTLSSKESYCKYNYKAFNNYEVNYHVLGETMTLNSCDSESCDVTMEDEDACAIIEQIKCSECNDATAEGECNQCKASFCIDCFSVVHNPSRVLQKHVFECFDNDKSEGSKNFAFVEKVLPDFPITITDVCNTHKRPQSIYCEKCQRSICKLCVSSHIDHVTHRLSEMNVRYLDDMPSTMNSINSSLFEINNAKKLLTNNKQKLTGYASEVYNKITTCYSRLHGLLQNWEHRTLEKLRDLSSAPQSHLVQRMSKLNAYEKLLSSMRHTLKESTKGGQIPQNICLKEMLNMYDGYLKKIRADMSVTELKENPYEFIEPSVQEFMDLLKDYNPKFNDPKLEVSFPKQIPYESRTTTLNNSGAEQPKEFEKEVVEKGFNRAIKYTGKCSSKDSKSDDKEESKIHMTTTELEKTISFLNMSDSDDKEKDPNSTHPKKHQEINDWFKSNITVRVRSIISPQDFYLQNCVEEDRIKEALNRFSETNMCSKPTSIVAGHHYMAYHPQRNDWYRAEILKHIRNGDTYEVLLADIGVQLSLPKEYFRNMPEHMLNIPYASVHCTLRQVMPPDGSNLWAKKATEFFKRVVENNAVEVLVTQTMSNNLYEVDLFVPHNGTKISLRDCFLYTGLAAPSKVELKKKDQKEGNQPLAEPAQRLPKLIPRQGDRMMIQIQHINNPHDFYAMPHRREALRKRMLADLNHTMSAKPLSQLQTVYLGRIQMAVVVMQGDKWHRASIEQILPKGKVVVRLVDWGHTHTLAWHELYTLPRDFWDSESSMQCSLADVQTLEKHSYLWTSNAIADFKQFSSNPNLRMSVIRIYNGIPQVALEYARTDSENNNVAALMVAQGHCASTGASSVAYRTPCYQKRGGDANIIQIPKQNNVQWENIVAPSPEEEGIEREPVILLSANSPDEFYVTLPQFQAAVLKLMEIMQDVAKNKCLNAKTSHEWNIGDQCFAKTKSTNQFDYEERWYRGKIVDVGNSPSTYDVYLRDGGEVVKNVPSRALVEMDDHYDRISDSAAYCKLYGIVPRNSDCWAQGAIEHFKSQLHSYIRIFVSGKGRDGNKLLVILWGEQTEISGPFSPELIKYVNINDELVNCGWATHTAQPASIESKNEMENKKEKEDDYSMQSTSLKVEQERKENIDKEETSSDDTEYISSEGSCSAFDANFEYNDEMPSIKLLKDLNATKPTTGCSKPPAAWLKPRPCNKTLFGSKPTNVGYDCEIYLTMASDEPYLTQMRVLLDRTFQQKMKSNPVIKGSAGPFVVNQPVVVMFHVDKSCYRGIIKSMETSCIWEVYFVDYGNTEMVKSHFLLPYAPFPKLHAMTWPVKLGGIVPKRSMYTIEELDMIHQAIVGKLVHVRLLKNAGETGGYATCQITIKKKDMAAILVAKNIAEFSSPSQKSKITPNQVLSDFKMFDTLQHICGDPSESVTSFTKPPPSKKQYIYESEQQNDSDRENKQNNSMNRLELKEQPIKYHEDRVKDIAVLSTNSTCTFSDISFNLRWKKTKVNASIMIQLNNRVSIQQCELRNALNFTPLDESTCKSMFRNTGCFLKQCIPEGIREFNCTVDYVISSTELQITPELAECKKQVLNLIQATHDLVEDTPPLKNVKVDSLCLALFSGDHHWYRAIIEEVDAVNFRADVFYLDFHNTETVPFAHLKEFPMELLLYPLRSFRAKLHGLKLSKEFQDKYVREKLQKLVLATPKLFARLRGITKRDSIKSINLPAEPLEESLLEVDLYHSCDEEELIYEYMINNWVYLPK